MAKTLGLLGKKVGMTRIFSNDGSVCPVTVIAAGPCPIMQIKSEDKEGYNALQLAYGVAKEKKLNKPERGHQAKIGKGFFRHTTECRVDNVAEYELGQELTVDIV